MFRFESATIKLVETIDMAPDNSPYLLPLFIKLKWDTVRGKSLLPQDLEYDLEKRTQVALFLLQNEQTARDRGWNGRRHSDV